MAQIHVLDEVTINKIAAGEVVERPASVIKELLENSLDAGATSIEIEIADGGITYMRVTDNGAGMTEEDARLAVLRHATSKIRSVDDLFDIASLGFRGEALASIASVSHFSLTTRTIDQELGTRITIDGGHVNDCMPFGAQPGTSIEVRDLFFNTPARRKFLKTERTETAKIQDIVGKLALSNPQVAFKLINNDSVSIVVPGNGDLVDTVSALYGYKVSNDIFPIAYEAEGIVVTGVVSKPTLLKSSRIWQTIVVNNRVISDKAITKAIDNAYHALLPKGGYPLVLLNITVPPETVDINVHPRKSEVKFSDDKPIFKAVYHAILQALQNPLSGTNQSSVGGDGLTVPFYNSKPLGQDLQFEGQTDEVKTGESRSPADSSNPNAIEEAITTAVSYENSFTSIGREKLHQIDIEPVRSDLPNRTHTEDFVRRLRQDGYTPPERVNYREESWVDSGDFEIGPQAKSYTEEDKARFHEIVETHRQQAFNDITNAYGTSHIDSSSNSEGSAESNSSSQATYGTSSDSQIAYQSQTVNTTGLLPLGQVAACYILAKKGDNLYIIDQHAAHERIRYDKLCKSAEAIPMQELLIPQYEEASEDELIIIEEQAESLLNLGFQVVQGGPTQFKVEGLPVDLVESKGVEILRYVFSLLKEEQEPTKAQLRHEMLAYASCRGAIKAGHTLNTYQMAVLIEELFKTDKPYVCPHGRPTIVKFTPEEMGKLFLRS
ncbi:DNA mismatch repair endonuclease MutL [uncultured Veillonella sp.]|uniref:DNA mismatch repair endonuclease MutL n=1 Tax=uncultured Veillonella sp. TaxID=159268 RepID=UPI0025F191B8|nr:DNA mismatch repair endonuclease MutL [uncultured Veillonella sp.]MDY3974331.1 DNA mismatch repair endonuclease MutL [Veillonella caviae]